MALTVHDIPGRAGRPPVGLGLPPPGPVGRRRLPAEALDCPDAAVAARGQDLYELVTEGADEAVDEEAAPRVEGEDEVGHLGQALEVGGNFMVSECLAVMSRFMYYIRIYCKCLLEYVKH